MNKKQPSITANSDRKAVCPKTLQRYKLFFNHKQNTQKKKNGIYVKRVAEQFFLVQHYESKETFNGYPLTVSDQMMSQGYQTIDGVKAYAKRLGFAIQGQIVQGKVVPLPQNELMLQEQTPTQSKYAIKVEEDYFAAAKNPLDIEDSPF